MNPMSCKDRDKEKPKYGINRRSNNSNSTDPNSSKNLQITKTGNGHKRGQ